MSFVEKCRRLIALDTSSSRGTKEAAEYLSDLCKAAGLYVEIENEFLDGLEQCNVIARPDSNRPDAELLLQTPMDTINPGHFSLWTRTQSNPFNASIYNDLIYGLGVADCKLDFLCKLEAARLVVGRSFRRPFVLVATYGSQQGMAGAIKLVRKKKINAKWALIGSPTDKALVVAAQGMAAIELFIPFSDEEKEYRRRHDTQESTSSQSRLFSGKVGETAIMKMLAYLENLPSGIAVMDMDGGTSHSSVPVSAVLEIDMMGGFHDPIVPKLAKLYRALLELEAKLNEFHDDRFDPPYPTMNLGTIRTTEDGVIFAGSCHLPPTVTDQVYDQWMAILKTACQQNNATLHVRDYRKGFEVPVESELVQVAAAVLGEIDLPTAPKAFAGATEASVYSRWGTECIVWGPGQGVGNSHAPNESIKMSDLDVAVNFYRRFLERFCL